MSPEPKKTLNRRLRCQKGSFYVEENRPKDTDQDQVDTEPPYPNQEGIQTINVVTGRRQSRRFLTIRTTSGKELRLPGPGRRKKCVAVEVNLNTGEHSITRIAQVEAEDLQSSQGNVRLRKFQDLSYQQASRNSELPPTIIKASKNLRKPGQSKILPPTPAL